MTQLVKCPACGVKTSAGRDACPRCETSLSGAPVCETTARAVAAHLPRRPGPETEPLRPTDPESPGPGDTAAPDRATFDTDISELFPKRRRFGVIDLLLVAGLVGWLVVLSDMRVWVEDGVVSFSTSSARAGIGLYPDFPKSTNTLYLYILRAKLSVRPAQVDGIYVNIISHGSTPARTRACSDTTPRPDALYRALSRLDAVSDQAHVNVTHCQI